MAAVAITRTYFRDVIDVTSETVWTIIDQGLNEFNSLVEYNKVDMKTLCTTIRCQSGMIINPRANFAAQPPTLRDPSHFISMVSKKHHTMPAYTEIHQARTSRPMDSQPMTRAFIMSLAPLQEQELAHSKPRAIDEPLRDTSMSDWFE